MISPERGKIAGADCSGILHPCTLKLKKTQSISLVWMKNADHLLFFANVIAGFFVGLTHLVTALNTFNNIDIILPPHGQRILRLARRAFCARDKAFT
jgi:hypothetical protein